ncbi:MAG TPA: serine protease [Kofleriaceae bacterium]|nr:serine protease [Kofleriaceae bacterium]
MSRRAVVAVAACVGAAACGESHAAQVCAGLRSASPSLVSQCGATADFTPINEYQGELAGVQEREDAVALINGTCTGTLIAATAGPVVLTAGHCVGLGDQELVAFNVEADPDGDPLVTSGTVIEQSSEPDYALLQLEALPAVTPTALTTQMTDVLAIIQHPRGGPKVIAEGSFLDACGGQIYYVDLDTLVGSSGAGVLNRQGFVVGVHTDGNCTEDGSGTNYGWSAARIVEASAYLTDADIAAR